MSPRSAPAARFDVREFARTVQGSHRGELELAAISAAGLDAEAARLARVLRAVERVTLQRMRNLLVTATHKDARVTAFLTSWAFERFWVADALDAVLEAAGVDDAPLTGPPRRRAAERAERRGPVRRAIAGMLAGPQLVAAHVTAGLVDEWIRQAAYRRLAEAAEVLSGAAARILALGDRHIAFLGEEAERRLGAGGRAVSLTRTELARQAWPVGAVELPDAERTFFESFVFGTPAGRAEAARIAERVAALPGLGPAPGATILARLAP
ncbi:MAG TPA: hypothetical protein VKY66_06180 [Protaetiibacter sp.]|nr:hypothetical protein [Protaetiibacter sp.]